MSEEQVSTPRRILKMLSSTLTPSSITPRSRKRTQSVKPIGNAIPIFKSRSDVKSIKNPFTQSASPIKKESPIPKSTSDKKVKMMEKTLESITPTTTPTKPSNITTISQLSPKKLDFKELVMGDSAKRSLVTPPVTPIKPDSEIKIDQVQPKKLELQVDETQDKENEIIQKGSIYSKAKAIFQRGFTLNQSESLPERELESRALKNFIKTHLINSQSSSLYISGPPGTGKTAQVNLTLSQFLNTNKHGVQNCCIDGINYKIGFTSINCMIISKISHIFAEIYKNLTNGVKPNSLQSSKMELLSLLSNTATADMNIVVLDELDKLVTNDQQILFELFSWTIFKESKFLLIGISNSLDMIDRLLPRLKINGLNPNTLSFMPYTADQIKSIIITKLKLLNVKDPNSTNIPIMHPAAIQLCAKKSSNNTGDLRKAFDICRNSIEMVEREIRGLNSQGFINKDIDRLIEFDEDSAPKVKINHIAKICASVFDNHQSTRLKNLNLQQKFIICMLIKKESETINEPITINSLYEYYVKKIEIDRLIGVLKKGEFLEIISALESIGILKISKANKQYNQIRITSSISQKDLKLIVDGVTVLEKLMGINGQDIK